MISRIAGGFGGPSATSTSAWRRRSKRPSAPTWSSSRSGGTTSTIS